MRRQKQESMMRYLLVFMLVVCLTPIVFAVFVHDSTPIEEPTETTITTEETTSTTTTETTTSATTTTTTETTTSLITTTYSTTSSTTTTTTTETSKLMTYDILQRIEIINILLDEKKYDRLIKKSPDALTTDERLELYYYNSLVLERKHLREYLEKNK